ncbi:MAG TPA: hypothetical protein VNQ80_17780 [Parapedobacter sp.]|uniref:hypothetical protein n=1 Tax=Parapedobacter sp. TaxID=1958893 RepID=UPI002B65BEDE|nr:hypothetical protein [Parapedobacter sp.]HWK59198.1 hypothetical protein [Parapedobacter sp.]
MMAVTIPVNNDILTWAIARAGYELPEFAEKYHEAGCRYLKKSQIKTTTKKPLKMGMGLVRYEAVIKISYL